MKFKLSLVLLALLFTLPVFSEEESFLKSHFFPNVGYPKFGERSTARIVFSEDNVFIGEGVVDALLPQINKIVYIVDTPKASKILPGKSSITFGHSNKEPFNLHHALYMTSAGEKGVGENLVFEYNFFNKIVNKKNKPKYDEHYYPVTLEVSQILKLYFRIKKISGIAKINYRSVLCATTIYKDQNCSADFVRGKKRGELFTVKGTEYKIIEIFEMESIDFDAAIDYQLKQGIKGANADGEQTTTRGFVPKYTKASGRVCIIPDFDCENGMDVFLGAILKDSTLGLF